MSYELLQSLVDQLEDENPKVREQAARRLGRLADPTTIPSLSNAYRREDEVPSVKRAAAEALGVFKAMEEALAKGENVELPDPETVKEPRVSSGCLRRLLTIMVVLMIALWLGNAALAFLPSLTPVGGSGGAPTSEQLQAQLRERLAQATRDVDNQRMAWQQMSSSGQLNCGVPRPESTSLIPLQIDYSAYPLLHDANLALVEGITRLTPAANNWLLGCSAGASIQVSAPDNLAFLDQAGQALERARILLDQAAAAAPVDLPTTAPSEVVPATVTTGATDVPATDVSPTATPEQPTPLLTSIPTEAPPPTSATTPLPLSADAYRSYLNDMRARIDLVMAGRGAVTLLTQYWTDVRTSGQSFGCGQPINRADLDDYTAISSELQALDPRLAAIQNMLNIGFALARDSLTSFEQGCTARNFTGLLEAGEQRIQQAANAFNQASLLMDQLQTEVGAQFGS